MTALTRSRGWHSTSALSFALALRSGEHEDAFVLFVIRRGRITEIGRAPALSRGVVNGLAGVASVIAALAYPGHPVVGDAAE